MTANHIARTYSSTPVFCRISLRRSFTRGTKSAGGAESNYPCVPLLNLRQKVTES